MTCALTLLDSIRRPRLLINAARIGMSDYRRETHLPRHLGGQRCPRSNEALLQLMTLEAEMDNRRRTRASSYSAARHVGLLIAMMGEARILRCTEGGSGGGQDRDVAAGATSRACRAVFS